MSSLFLNRIGNPPVIPKTLIWVESDNMFGFDELFFLWFLQQSLNQSQSHLITQHRINVGVLQ